MVPRMVCSSLRAHWALFWGAGGANRVLILSQIFGALQRHLRRAGWDGLGGGHLDNVCNKSARVLKIASDRSCQSRICSRDSEPSVLGLGTMMSLLSAPVSALESKLGAFGYLGNVQIYASACLLRPCLLLGTPAH